jgi:hypothetical protein
MTAGEASVLVAFDGSGAVESAWFVPWHAAVKIARLTKMSTEIIAFIVALKLRAPSAAVVPQLLTTSRRFERNLNAPN